MPTTNVFVLSIMDWLSQQWRLPIPVAVSQASFSPVIEVMGVVSLDTEIRWKMTL